MASFFNFRPKDITLFEIESPPKNISPKYNKENQLDFSLDKNIDAFKDLLHFPDSNDLIFRFFDIHINQEKYHAMLLMYDGLCDSNLINDYIMRQLMDNITMEPPQNKSIIKQKQLFSIKDVLVGGILSESQVSFAQTYEKVITSILHGDCALIVDTLDKAIISDVKKIPSRSINKSENEMTVKGPAESFIENFRSNTALIRKFVKDENLIFETIEVGMHSKTKCAVAYITNITNDSLINEVKKRIKSIDVDYLIDAGQLEQLIEDHTFIVEPLVLSTERPDKVAANLAEGRVAIIVENSPDVLIVPAVFTDFLKSSEDSYIRYPYTLLLRLFRVPATILSVLLPRTLHCYYHISSRNDTNGFIVFYCWNKRKSSLFYADRTLNYGNCI